MRKSSDFEEAHAKLTAQMPALERPSANNARAKVSLLNKCIIESLKLIISFVLSARLYYH